MKNFKTFAATFATAAMISAGTALAAAAPAAAAPDISPPTQHGFAVVRSPHQPGQFERTGPSESVRRQMTQREAQLELQYQAAQRAKQALDSTGVAAA